MRSSQRHGCSLAQHQRRLWDRSSHLACRVTRTARPGRHASLPPRLPARIRPAVDRGARSRRQEAPLDQRQSRPLLVCRPRQLLPRRRLRPQLRRHRRLQSRARLRRMGRSRLPSQPSLPSLPTLVRPHRPRQRSLLHSPRSLAASAHASGDPARRPTRDRGSRFQSWSTG